MATEHLFPTLPTSLLLLLFVTLHCVAPSQSAAGLPDNDREVMLGGSLGLVAYVSRKGAVIRVHRDINSTSSSSGNAAGERQGQSGEVVLFLDTIEEVDGQSLERLNGSAKIHSFNNVDFDIVRQDRVLLPLGPGSTDAVYADCLNCSATLDASAAGGSAANISLSICAITDNGTFDLGGERTSVAAGQLKIGFQLADWTWNSTSNKLAADFVIRVPSGRSVTNSSSGGGGASNSSRKFLLGADAFVDFSRMTCLDGEWKAMPVDYPRLTANGASSRVIVILDHFNASAVYDPNLEVGYTVEDDRSGGQLAAGGGGGGGGVWLLLLISLSTSLHLYSSHC